MNQKRFFIALFHFSRTHPLSNKCSLARAHWTSFGGLGGYRGFMGLQGVTRDFGFTGAHVNPIPPIPPPTLLPEVWSLYRRNDLPGERNVF